MRKLRVPHRKLDLLPEEYLWAVRGIGIPWEKPNMNCWSMDGRQDVTVSEYISLIACFAAREEAARCRREAAATAVIIILPEIVNPPMDPRRN